ncbi:hypothetical protein FN846DRAFT_911495 [Sphaerosporella brunnea]|uniref:Uncharacterized protein n=1 Tax=Sphaerosporella brunnea TaxID=1250544 RepID=A0A5J5EKE3_9PEZI|nr:hypothetical protein FN846DRAFT_911495 [Sphaerosporella brunnea]
MVCTEYVMPLFVVKVELTTNMRYIQPNQLLTISQLMPIFGPIPRLILNHLLRARLKAERGDGMDNDDDQEMQDASEPSRQAQTDDMCCCLEGLIKAELEHIQSSMIDLLRLDCIAFAEQQFGKADSHSLCRFEKLHRQPEDNEINCEMETMRSFGRGRKPRHCKNDDGKPLKLPLFATNRLSLHPY